MILVLRESATPEQIASLKRALSEMQLEIEEIDCGRSRVMALTGDASTLPSHFFSRLPAVSKAIRVDAQLSLSVNARNAGIDLPCGVRIGGASAPVFIAGPCSVESPEHTRRLARMVKAAGAGMLRGGAFKPRTSPYDFQGLGLDGLKFLAEARSATGLPVVSEVMSAAQVELAEPYVDMFQIGTRNMYNYDLLKEVGRALKPVLLKRAMSATINEWLSAAEYVMLEGNLQVVLCERGIRTFETQTRNTLDLAGVAAVKKMSPLPVVVDPSHATGAAELVRPMALAAIAGGADGLMIEVHDDPGRALSDQEQAITPEELKEIICAARAIVGVLGCSASPAAAQLSPQPVCS